VLADESGISPRQGVLQRFGQSDLDPAAVLALCSGANPLPVFHWRDGQRGKRGRLEIQGPLDGEGPAFLTRCLVLDEGAEAGLGQISE
jgi:hypothetical protein